MAEPRDTTQDDHQVSDVNEPRAVEGWLGRVVDGYVIRERLGGGRFSSVYLGTDDTGRSEAFKVAEHRSTSTNADTLPAMAARGLMWITGGIQDVAVEPGDLLKAQVTKLSGVADPAVIAIDQVGADYYRMEYVEGPTLRQVMEAGSVSVELVLNIIEALGRLERTGWLPHGDLKPENILAGTSSVRLIDPGFAGPLPTEFGQQDCIITTPAYYPELLLDDHVAVGIMLWEIALGDHPLLGVHSARDFDRSRIGEALFARVRGHQLVGQHYSDGLLNLRLPSEIDDALSPQFSTFILRAMRLMLTPDGKLDVGEGFKNFAAMADHLRRLTEEEHLQAFEGLVVRRRLEASARLRELESLREQASQLSSFLGMAAAEMGVAALEDFRGATEHYHHLLSEIERLSVEDAAPEPSGPKAVLSVTPRPPDHGPSAQTPPAAPPVGGAASERPTEGLAEAIYSRYIRPLALRERLRLLEMLAHDLAAAEDWQPIRTQRTAEAPVVGHEGGGEPPKPDSPKRAPLNDDDFRRLYPWAVDYSADPDKFPF